MKEGSVIQRKSHIGVTTFIYAAVLVLTVVSFFFLWNSESLFRFMFSLTAVVIAESMMYGYSIFWLRNGQRVSKSSPVIISGAFITILYALAVFVFALIFDLLLELPPFWYSAGQLLILGIGSACLLGVGWYGKNAVTQEKRAEESSRSLRRHKKEVAEIRQLALTWKHSERGQLVKWIQTLEDRFTYSDPVSSPSLYATEDILTQQISLLRDHLELLIHVAEPQVGWEAETNELIESITNTLQRRNRELSALK